MAQSSVSARVLPCEIVLIFAVTGAIPRPLRQPKNEARVFSAFHEHCIALHSPGAFF
jgi:hypothetical protein